MNTNEEIDLATDHSAEPVALVNLSAISPALVLVTRWKSTNGLVVKIPASSAASPVAARLNAKIGRFMLRLYGEVGGNRGWRGLREWKSPTNVPETGYDRETMRMLKEQDLVLAGKKAPPQFADAQTRPYLGGGQAGRKSKSMVGVIPSSDWTREMFVQWRFLNGIDPIPGESLADAAGLAASISTHATLARELSKFRQLRAPAALAAQAAKAQNEERRAPAAA